MHQDKLTEVIIGAAHRVLYELKPGLDEKLYERALSLELTSRGIRCESQKQYQVFYGPHHIGTLIPDLIANDLVVVDAKVATSLNDSHLAQMLGYLNITGLKTALLLNFKHSSLGFRRISA